MNLSYLADFQSPTEETTKKVWTLTMINFRTAAWKADFERMRERAAAR